MDGLGIRRRLTAGRSRQTWQAGGSLGCADADPARAGGPPVGIPSFSTPGLGHLGPPWLEDEAGKKHPFSAGRRRSEQGGVPPFSGVAHAQETRAKIQLFGTAADALAIRPAVPATAHLASGGDALMPPATGAQSLMS